MWFDIPEDTGEYFPESLVIISALTVAKQGTGGIKGVEIEVPARSRADTQFGEIRSVYIEL